MACECASHRDVWLFGIYAQSGGTRLLEQLVEDLKLIHRYRSVAA